MKSYLLFFAVGFFEATLPFYLVAWGQQHVDSSIAAILMSTIPLFTVLLVAFFVKTETISSYQLVAIIFGFFGVCVLLGPQAMVQSKNLLHNLVGELSIVGGAISFAISLILIRSISHLPSIRSARNILFCASIQMFPVALYADKPWELHYTGVSICSVGVLGVFAAGLVYVMYMVLIKRAGVTFTSFNSYLVPVVGLTFGVFILQEPIAWNVPLALVILLVAMFLSNKKSIE